MVTWSFHFSKAFVQIFKRRIIWGLCSNFFECESFLILSETNLDDAIDSIFSVRGVFLQKDSGAHAWSRSYMKKGLPLARDLSLENSVQSYLCFWLDLLLSVSYFCFLYWLPSLPLCTVFNPISSNIDEVFLINPSVNVLVLETLTSIIRTC